MSKLRPSRYRPPYKYGNEDERTIFVVEPDDMPVEVAADDADANEESEKAE